MSHSAFLDGEVVPFEVVSLERRFVYHYKFNGLGPARSLLLSEAHHRFGNIATHYFIADPDWRFKINPQESVKSVRGEIRRSMSGNELILPFKIFDRNGASSRWLDWFLRARPGLAFKYRWHEMLDVPDNEYTYAMVHSFTVTETEGGSESYHNEESGGSGTVARFEREIGHFELDLMDYPDDTRVLYYLGVDHCSILQLYKQEAVAKGGFTQWRSSVLKGEYESHWKAALRYLRRRVWDLWDDSAKHPEMAWAAAKWLGQALYDLALTDNRVNREEALRAFDLCIDIDKERVECRIQKARLLLDLGDMSGGWEAAREALKLEVPERSFLLVPYHYTCSVFVVAAKAAILSGDAQEGGELLQKAMAGCSEGIYDEAPTILQTLSDMLKAPPPLKSRISVPAAEDILNNGFTSPGPESNVVRGIRAAKSQPAIGKLRTAPRTTKVVPTSQSPASSQLDLEFLNIASRWLELAGGAEGSERATLIAKALLAHPSEETLQRAAQLLPACTQHDMPPPSRNLEEELRKAEGQVAVLLQQMARTDGPL